MNPDSNIILITGASGGLGIAVTSRLISEGYRLHAALRNPEGEKLLREKLPQAPVGRLTTVPADVSTESGVKDFISGVGPVSGLVHLAGGFLGSDDFGSSGAVDFDAMMNQNARSAYLLLRAVMPLMRTQGGSIVTIGAKAAVHPAPGNPAYAASKAAVVALTLCAAEEGRSHGIRANCILPAVIRTEANRQAMPGMDPERWTPPEEIADLIAFLLSNASRGVTGMFLPMYHGIRS
ncbi:MAG TPA: SDR family oxidoreductase [Chitinophagaceae bacterium]|nr:SDR family oxidoreductase [Chitinophagaceae bacterium]